jgi:hypothetical protein
MHSSPLLVIAYSMLLVQAVPVPPNHHDDNGILPPSDAMPTGFPHHYKTNPKDVMPNTVNKEYPGKNTSHTHFIPKANPGHPKIDSKDVMPNPGKKVYPGKKDKPDSDFIPKADPEDTTEKPGKKDKPDTGFIPKINSKDIMPNSKNKEYPGKKPDTDFIPKTDPGHPKTNPKKTMPNPGKKDNLKYSKQEKKPEQQSGQEYPTKS